MAEKRQIAKVSSLQVIEAIEKTIFHTIDAQFKQKGKEISMHAENLEGEQLSAYYLEPEGDIIAIQSEPSGSRTPLTVTVIFASSGNGESVLMLMARSGFGSWQSSKNLLLITLKSEIAVWPLNLSMSSPPSNGDDEEHDKQLKKKKAIETSRQY